MQVLDHSDLEAQFGLLIRHKRDHNNCVLLKLSDLNKTIRYYADFKNQISHNKKITGDKK